MNPEEPHRARDNLHSENHPERAGGQPRSGVPGAEPPEKNSRVIRFTIGVATLAIGACSALTTLLPAVPDWLGCLLLLLGVILIGTTLPKRVLEPLAIVLLIAGGLMNCQPHLIDLFRYNTAVLVIAAALFTVASHLADDRHEPTRLGARTRTLAVALIALGGAALVQPWWLALAIPGAIAVAIGVAATVVSSLLARPVEAA